MNVQAVSERLSNLGEGPHWDVKTQKLYHVDIFFGDVCRLDPKTGISEVVHLNKCSSFVIPFEEDPNQLLITQGNEVHKLNFKTGETVHLKTVEPDSPSRFNDGKCDAKGRLWTGTLTDKLFENGHLYRMDSSHNFIAYLDNVKCSNGLAWSLNNDTLYYIDSYAKKVYAFDYNLQDGTASNRRILFDFEKEEFKDCGIPDGMTIDVDGKLWVACYAGSCVFRLDPKSKSVMNKVPIPAFKVTSCCFGGENLDVLYVTTGAAETEEEKKKLPKAGAVFAITGHGTRGLPPNNYVDSQ